MSCVLLGDGTVRCAGILSDRSNDCLIRRTQDFLPISLPEPVRSIAVLDSAACGRTIDGRILCWGRLDTHDGPPCHPRLVVRSEDGELDRKPVRLEVGLVIDMRGRARTWDPNQEQLESRPHMPTKRFVDGAVSRHGLRLVDRRGRVWSEDDGLQETGDGRVVGVRWAASGPLVTVHADGRVVEHGDPDGPFRPLPYASETRARDAFEEVDSGGWGGCLSRYASILCWGHANLRADDELAEVPLPP